MWDSEKQHQLDDLQRRAQHAPLPAADQQQLEHLVRELEREEWAALRPALAHLRHDQEELQATVSQVQMHYAMLGVLAERYADLLARAKVQLDALTRERETLRQEYVRTLQDAAPR